MTATSATRHYFDSPEEFKRYENRELYRMNRESEREGLQEKGIVIGEECAEEKMVRNQLESVSNPARVASMLKLDVDKVRSIAEKFGLFFMRLTERGATPFGTPTCLKMM